MLVSTELPRKFTFKKGAETINLPDVDPTWSPEQVLSFYANTYPELATSKPEGPTWGKNTVDYSFTTQMGTKG